jgi:hypothetical protein
MSKASIGVSDGHLYYLNSLMNQQSCTEPVECNLVLDYVSDIDLCHANFKEIKEWSGGGGEDMRPIIFTSAFL